MAAGVVLALVGIWVLAQVLKGGAIKRLGL
jgi:hypothetical protein